MGYTLRTKIYRYTAWVQFDNELMEPNWDEIVAEELYDHTNDPQENMNVVDLPQYSEQKRLLKETLRTGWRSKL